MKTQKKPFETKSPDPSDPVLCVTALGLVTSVGHDHITACASMRAEFKEPSRLPNYYVETQKDFEDPDDGYVAGHPVLDGDPDEGLNRMATLLSMALSDLGNGLENPSFLDETPLYLALPEPQRLEPDDENLFEYLKSHGVRPQFQGLCRIYRKGHAGMIFALSDAAAAIIQGKYPRMIIAGTDSLINFDDLSRLDDQHRLKTILPG